MKTSETIKEIIPALLKVQKEIKAVTKNQKAIGEKFSYNYADLESVIDNSKKVLNANGIVFIQAVCNDSLITRLIHAVSGEWIEDCGVKIVSMNPNDPQKQGSAITYARRYGLMTITGMSAEDDDGRAASTNDESFDKQFPDNQAGSIVKLECSNCSAPVTEKVASYSKEKLGKVLCFNCQKI